MKLEINVPVSGLDLASLLESEQGVFLCQNRGQNYITVAKSGHSIAFGPMPIGKAIQEQPITTLAPEPCSSRKSATQLISLNFVEALAGKAAENCPRKLWP
jgi:hypothetical protein